MVRSIVGTLVEAGVRWQSIAVATGAVIALLAVAYAVMLCVPSVSAEVVIE